MLNQRKSTGIIFIASLKVSEKQDQSIPNAKIVIAPSMLITHLSEVIYQLQVPNSRYLLIRYRNN